VSEKDSQPRKPKVRVERAGQMPSSSEPKPEQSIEHLLVDDVEQNVDVQGVRFTIREIDGKTLMKILDVCTKGDPTNPRSWKLDRAEYFARLIDACVVKPKLPMDRIKPGVFTELGTKLEEALGMGEVAQKKLEEMSKSK